MMMGRFTTLQQIETRGGLPRFGGLSNEFLEVFGSEIKAWEVSRAGFVNAGLLSMV